MALGPRPKWANLPKLQTFGGKPAPPKLSYIYSVWCTASMRLLSTLFAQFQFGFYKGLFCLIGTDKIPRIKAMPIILLVNVLIFCHHSQFLLASLVSAHTSSHAHIESVEVIPLARAALASVGKKNTPTNSSALEFFLWYSTLALLWLAATAPVYRKKTHHILRKNKCTHQQLQDQTS